ncbi:hypothetical protein CDAR_184111 [Caerostris darwini]|uniref:LAGLIDADG homing endonuclease n=1 Tax=Caerostris darwini TaxID=1538125 RepID=A0AAV4QPV9_9ARAC|nr:hypothetical protein CDAR_184111 [Caerostris darwini]
MKRTGGAEQNQRHGTGVPIECLQTRLLPLHMPMRRTIYLGTNQNSPETFYALCSIFKKFIVPLSVVNMDPVKRSKHSDGFKIKVIQFSEENGNHAAARMFDVSENSQHEWKKNKMTITNMSRNKCALLKGVPKWLIIEESAANWFEKMNQTL